MHVQFLSLKTLSLKYLVLPWLVQPNPSKLGILQRELPLGVDKPGALDSFLLR